MDITTLCQKDDNGSSAALKHGRILIDKKSPLKFSNVYDTKNGMVEPTCKKVNWWKQAGQTVKYFRMDNTGENKVLEQRANLADWKLGLQYEYTACKIPQQNHLAELTITSITNKGRACMAAANVPPAGRYALGPKAFQYTTKTDRLCW